MPLSVPVLSSAIESELTTAYSGTPSWQDAAGFKKFCDALAQAIVTHITTQAVVIGVCPNGGGPLTGGQVT